MGQKIRDKGESGDQDVGREFLVKVFPNERIIMQRSLPPLPPITPRFSPSSLSPIGAQSLHPSVFFSPLSHLSLSLCFSGLTLVPTSLKSLARCLPPYFCNLVYFLPHSCFLYLSCFSSFPLFAPPPPHPTTVSQVLLGLRQSAALKPLYQHIPAIVGSDSHFHCRIG